MNQHQASQQQLVSQHHRLFQMHPSVSLIGGGGNASARGDADMKQQQQQVQQRQDQQQQQATSNFADVQEHQSLVTLAGQHVSSTSTNENGNTGQSSPTSSSGGGRGANATNRDETLGEYT